uniref:myelin-associated glycoprotein-like n=1 Tax=Monopterus albus TaxID=43700 RepID=UPI0009B3A55C|nr:myelin-associated glycoprotein-like [Monopterus albus]
MVHYNNIITVTRSVTLLFQISFLPTLYLAKQKNYLTLRHGFFLCHSLLFLPAICSPVFTEDWKAKVVPELDALVTSCVAIPCSFTYPKDNLPSSKLRGIWHLSDPPTSLVYHEDQTRVLDNFKGRTRLLGTLGQNNCTLEMTEVKDHDSGPFCFRIELAKTNEPTRDKFSFVEDCVTLKMLHEPPTPTLTKPDTATVGRSYTVTCSVKHTCSSHQPTLTWSRSTDVDVKSYREIHSGNWEVQSTLTFTPEEKDDHEDITCTATFNGMKTSTAKFTLFSFLYYRIHTSAYRC